MHFHWNLVSAGKRGVSWSDFLEQVRQLPPGQIWRYGQAGDLPGVGGRINATMLRELTEANRGKLGFGYTHKPMHGNSNRAAVREANKNGFTINLSANNFDDADRLAWLCVAPIATLAPLGSSDVSYTRRGRKVVLCPAQTREDITCMKCRICANASRKFIVGFLPHGPLRIVDRIANGHVKR